MIEKYVPLDDDGTITSREQVAKDFQVSVISNTFLPYYQSSPFCQINNLYYFVIQEFYTHQREWFHTFWRKRLDVLSRDYFEKNNKEFGISDVKEWAERHGVMNGHLRFFENFAQTSSSITRWPRFSSLCKPLDQLMLSAGSKMSSTKFSPTNSTLFST